MLCVLSGALPAEAISNPGGLMACCRGMKGMGGTGGNSCPLCRRAKAKSKPPRPVRRERMCGADLALRKKGGAALASHALLLRAGFDDQLHAEVEHDNGDGVPPRNTPQSTSRRASAGGAFLTKPCPSDCCGTAAGSLNGPPRPRHEAALTEGVRPLPPTAGSHTYISAGLIKSTYVLSRSHPPRAPPTALRGRTA
jgi:hypothetical protein